MVHGKWYMVHATVCVKNVVLLYRCTQKRFAQSPQSKYNYPPQSSQGAGDIKVNVISLPAVLHRLHEEFHLNSI